ncbi:Helix-turn-helix domain containing protein [uncultured Caudovirales phage]|uniref:Helix-turn-helix domain containing protein n=1 Tax=uncultured Caudovirales phage TaxID=2100421 RepID=A0A6J7WDG1_9CAUD|nr:Helix-turn-helix domain containing protein [uncultured Caudovirales phage]
MLISEDEAARRLGRSKRFVYELRKRGAISYLPSAGRAKIMIDEESLNTYIRENLCQEKQPHHGSKSGKATTTSSTVSQAAAAERAFGQMIFTSRNNAFKDG